jgi:hypothetical protein
VDKPDYFFGLEPNWFTRDRLFMVFVTRDALSGAYVAGQFYDEGVARLQLQQLAPLLGWWVRRLVAQRKLREQEYAAINPLSGDFLNKDRRNFCIFSKQLLDVTVRRKPSLWAPNSVGTVRVTLATGEIKKLILIAGQNPDALATMLGRVCPDTKVEGKASVLKSPPLEEQDARRLRVYSLCSVVFLMSGAGLAFVAFDRGQNPGLWTLAGFNLLAAIYFIVRAAMGRKPATVEKQDDLLHPQRQRLDDAKFRC